MNQQKGPGSQAPSPTIPYGPAMPPAMPALNTSASFASATETASPQVENQSLSQSQSETQEKEKPKFFFREKYAKLGVRGNFMPLAAQPKNVDVAEWLAHQGKFLLLWHCATSIKFHLRRDGTVPSGSCTAPVYSGSRC